MITDKTLKPDNKAAPPNDEYLETLERLNRQCSGGALLRLWQIVGDKKKGIPALLPIGKTVFWQRVKAGIYPAPVRLGRTVCWRYRDIMEIIENAEPWRGRQ
jgi:predicted DNA-binding transcriptional regulator AlpA